MGYSAAAAAAAKSLQSCLTLCDPLDSSPPDSSVYGILQARILGWVAISERPEFQGENQGKKGHLMKVLLTNIANKHESPLMISLFLLVIELFLCVKHCLKSFAYTISFNPHHHIL